MISFISGKVQFYDKVSVIVNVGGVGYRIFCPPPVLENVQSVNEGVSLYVHSYIREDRFDLFGFLNQDDLNLFQLLISVSGVGPKTALSIFSSGGSSSIKDALSRSDVDFFSSVTGLGKKTAQKIIIELRGKVGSLDDSLESVLEDKKDEDAILALKQLGYRVQEISNVLKNVDKDLPTSAKVKEVLRLMSNRQDCT